MFRDRLDYLFCLSVQTSSLDNSQLPCSLHGKFIFPLLPYSLQFFDVHVVQLVHIRFLWLACLLYLDGSAHYDIEWSPIGEDARVVIEHSSRMEQGNGKSQYFLYDKLRFVDKRVLFGLHLVV